MIEEIGIVSDIEVNDEKRVIWVETQVKSTCGSCAVNANCGTSVLAKAFTKKSDLLRFEIYETVNIGQKVKLGIPEEQILKMSFLVYVIPLCVLLFSAVLSASILPLLGFKNEIWVVLATFICTLTSFVYLKFCLNRESNKDLHPHILSFLPFDIDPIEVKQL